MSREYDNTNSGALWANRDGYEVVRGGDINIEGDERRWILVKNTGRNGKTYFDLYEKIGPMFVNERKRGDKDPDTYGYANLREGDYAVWGRKGETRDGSPMTRISIAPKQDGNGGQGRGDNRGGHSDPNDPGYGSQGRGGGQQEHSGGFDDDLDDPIPF